MLPPGATRFALGAGGGAFPRELYPPIFRWHHFIVALGHKVPIRRNLEIYLAASALILTPGNAGETIRSVYLHPCGVSYPHTIGIYDRSGW